MIDVKMKEI